MWDMKMLPDAFSSCLVRGGLACFFWLGTPCQLLALCYQLTIAVTVMITMVISETTSASQTMLDSRCNLDNGLVPDQSSCRGFIICLKGRARALQCSRDLLFNTDRLTCDFPDNVVCGTRPRNVGGGTCYSAKVNVTVSIRNEVKDPMFQANVTVSAQRQPLRHILLIAAGMDPRFRYETIHFDGYGDFVSSINGVSNDITDRLAVWQPFNKKGSIIRQNLDEYIPENEEVITYVYIAAQI